MNGSWILSGILALPLIGALCILLLPRIAKRPSEMPAGSRYSRR